MDRLKGNHLFSSILSELTIVSRQVNFRRFPNTKKQCESCHLTLSQSALYLDFVPVKRLTHKICKGKSLWIHTFVADADLGIGGPDFRGRLEKPPKVDWGGTFSLSSSSILRLSNLLCKANSCKYGKITLKEVQKNCESHAKSLNFEIKFEQSNIEGEIVTIIQDARNKYDGIIINAAGFTHTSVSIRDALDIFKKPIIELHISNIYKREEFRHKSLISDIVTGGIFGLGVDGYILAIISMQKLLQNENW